MNFPLGNISPSVLGGERTLSRLALPIVAASHEAVFAVAASLAGCSRAKQTSEKPLIWTAWTAEFFSRPPAVALKSRALDGLDGLDGSYSLIGKNNKEREGVERKRTL